MLPCFRSGARCVATTIKCQQGVKRRFVRKKEGEQLVDELVVPGRFILLKAF